MAVRIADNVLVYQHASGGWPKNIDMAAVLSESDKDSIRDERARGGTALSEPTIDNGATHTQMRFLAQVYDQTGHARFEESFLRGLDYLLEAQYEHGGWPQFYPLRGGYYDHITYNDGAMIGVLELLRDVAAGRPAFAFVDEARRPAVADAVDRGIDIILRTQIEADGKRTAWCAQHDEKTLEPAWARTYEPPSLAGAATVGIVRFLMSVESPSAEVVAAIEGAVEWLRDTAIYGVRYGAMIDSNGQQDRGILPDSGAGPIWARFYEIGSNRPIFLGRDSVVRYALDEIEWERRNNYAYYGAWGIELLAVEYPAWKTRHSQLDE